MRYLIIFSALFLSACGGGQMAPTPQIQSHALKVVFIGDSLTQHWDLATSFPGQNYINKGVSGNTTADIRDRFMADAVSQNPDVIMLMAGTNDMNGFPYLETQNNIRLMIGMAQSAKIRIVLATIPPKSEDLAWENSAIVTYNEWLKTLGVPIADYYPALVNANGELRTDLAFQDLPGTCCQHLNPAGYIAISPIASVDAR